MESPNMQTRRYCVVYEVSNSSTDFYSEERRAFHETHEQMITFLVKLVKENKRVMATYECTFLPMDRQEIQDAVDFHMVKMRQDNINATKLKNETQEKYREFLSTLTAEERKVLAK